MRPLIIVGIVIALVGAFVLIRGGSFTSQRDVFELGDVRITADEKQSIPPWVGGVGMLVGVAVIVAGVRQQRA